MKENSKKKTSSNKFKSISYDNLFCFTKNILFMQNIKNEIKCVFNA